MSACRALVRAARYGLAMRAERAIESLEGLKEEAATTEVMRGGEHLTAWKGKVRGGAYRRLG